MENATKALLMAAGVLIGVLLLSLMASLFISSKNVANEYEKTKQSEAVQQFNANFTQYLGKELTIHDVVTICNFAKNNKIKQVQITNGNKDEDDLKSIVNNYNQDDPIQKYNLKIVSFDDKGYVKNIEFLEIA